MTKRVIVAGLLGTVVLLVWTFVANGVFGFRPGIDMKKIPAERQVYEILSRHISDPGRYMCNPQLTPEMRFPAEEPVFSVLYGGVGHGSAGSLMLVGLVVFLVAPMIGAWMLSQTSDRVLASYPRKVLFFVAIGLLFAVFGELTRFGIGGYPLRDALLLAAHDVFAWTLIGLVVAWRVRPVAGT